MTPTFSPVNFDFRAAASSIGPDITVDVDPSNPASVSFQGGVRFGDAPADIKVTARIDSGAATFAVRDLITLDWVWEPGDPSELPPGHHGPPPRVKVLERSSTHDGAGTIAVKAGQVLLVRVMYSSTSNPGTFPGNLSVSAPGWGAVNVPLTLTTFTPPEVTLVETRLLRDSIVIVAGQQATLPVEVKWISGPASNIAFEKSPIYLDAMVSMQPTSVHVEPQQTVTVPLVLQAAQDANTGTFDLAIRQYVSRPPYNLALRITIEAAPPPPPPVRKAGDCIFGDPPGSPVISPKAYGLVNGFPRMPSQLTYQVVGTSDSGTLPTPIGPQSFPIGPQSLLAQTNPPELSSLGSAIAQAFAIWGAAFPSGPKITATLINGVADIQFNTGTLNAKPSGTIAGFTRVFTDAEVSARGGKRGVQITFESSNFVWRPNQAAILPTDPPGTLSLLAKAIHEIGHALGLLHNTGTASVMFHSSSLEALGPEDVAAIEALYDWSPQRRVPNVGTEAAPGLCACADRLVMAWRGTGSDHNLWYAVSFDGQSWSDQRKIIGAASDDGPSLAYDGFTLWMAWKGIPGDHALYYATWDLIGTWTTPQAIPGVGSSNGPALSIVSGIPFMVWRGLPGDSGIYYAAYNRAKGQWDGQKNVGGVGTSGRPSVTQDPLSNSPRMVWKGIQGDDNLYTSELRGQWQPPISDAFWQPQQQVGWVVAGNSTAGTVAIGHPGSAFGPSLASVPGKIFMAWRGVEQDQDLWFTQGAPDSPPPGGGPSIVEWSTQANVGGFATSNLPSVTVFKGNPFLAWKGEGSDRSIFTTTFA